MSVYIHSPPLCDYTFRVDLYIPMYILTVMDRLLKKFAGLVETGEVVAGRELPMQFTFSELEYLFNKGFIYNDGTTFIVSVTDLDE